MKQIAVFFFLVTLAASAAVAQSGGSGQLQLHAPCLWAGLSANEPVFKIDPHENVMLSFALVNDCAETVDVASDDWKLVINGEEVTDSDSIFGNGSTTTNGWAPLRPGDSYTFTRSLALSRYFGLPGIHRYANGIYKVSWRGKDFESSAITIRVVGKGKLLPTR